MFALLQQRELHGAVRFAHEECVWTHDNGGRPFKVVIRDHAVEVHEHDVLVWSIRKARRVFVGQSPADHPSTVYSENCKGNSVLIETASREYVFVGHCLFCLSTIDPVRDNDSTDWRDHGFVSPVGNSDVPYPYAIDLEGRYYLLTEQVRLDAVPDEAKDDPYYWYYRRRRITHDRAYVDSPLGRPYKVGNVQHFYLGDEEYTCIFWPDYDVEYDRIVTVFGPVSVQYYGQTQRVRLDKSDYTQWMRAFGEEAGFSCIHARPCPRNHTLSSRF